MISLAWVFSISDEDHPSARRRDRSAADAGGDDVARAGAALHEIVGQVHHFAEAVIHHGKPPVGGEHAQAVGHVVQGGVELAGQRRFPETRGQRLHEYGMKVEVDAFQADEEQHQQHGEADVIESAMQHQRQRHRPAGQQDLILDEPRAAVIAGRAASGIADRHGDAHHVRDGIVTAENGDEAPEPERRHRPWRRSRSAAPIAWPARTSAPRCAVRTCASGMRG